MNFGRDRLSSLTANMMAGITIYAVANVVISKMLSRHLRPGIDKLRRTCYPNHVYFCANISLSLSYPCSSTTVLWSRYCYCIDPG